ncbi:MAG: hypothetical protein M1434_08140 [Chloroflexi bacterium]|nr:hypothetical protein [Chloroflexota bacterium]
MKKILFSLMAFVLFLGTASSPAAYAASNADTPPLTRRISFAAGATSGLVEGDLTAFGYQNFLVRAGAGSTMSVSLTANNTSAYIRVYRRFYWGALWGSGDGATTWTRVLPASGDYVVQVVGPAGTHYSLNVVIPARIRFAYGAYSGTVTGHTDSSRINSYIAWARAGQTMTATLTSSGDPMGITVYGLTDGIPLVRAVSGATSWSGVLPASQNYIIDAAPSTGNPVSYSLTLTITN